MEANLYDTYSRLPGVDRFCTSFNSAGCSSGMDPVSTVNVEFELSSHGIFAVICPLTIAYGALS